MTALWPAYVNASGEVANRDIAVSAQGVRVRFADGSERLCATSGLWNAPLGYGVPEISAAIDEAVRSASYLTLFRRAHMRAIDAAESICDYVGESQGRVVFSTSGGAALDATVKLVRQHWALKGMPGRQLIVSLRESYHGTMMGSHALSGAALDQGVYALDRRSIRHVLASDDGATLSQLMAREGDRVAAVILEPVLGNGAIDLSEHWLKELEQAQSKYGFLLVADEVATGFWRTGPALASRTWPTRPDIVVLSKALTNGTQAASAIVVSRAVSEVLERHHAVFVHGETQAGTPAACAAILATLEMFGRMGVERQVAELTARLHGLVGSVARSQGLVLRGSGLFIAVAPQSELPLGGAEVAEIVRAISQRGVDVQPGPGCVQLVPAYVMSDEDLCAVVGAVASGIADWRGSRE